MPFAASKNQEILMLEIKKNTVTEQLSDLKQQYMELTTAPLDGMWLCGFVPMAKHFGFYEGDTLVGFCCINEEGYLLQFYLCSEFETQASPLLHSILTQNDSPTGKINGAFASTAEPLYLSICLDTFSTFKVSTLMYQLSNRPQKAYKLEPVLQMKVVTIEQLAEAVDFAKKALGAPEKWLTEYFTNLINRQELRGFWKKGQLLATGECRGFDDYQQEYADLGFIVDESQRGKGLGTQVLRHLICVAVKKGLQPICSTEKTNIGAQKAMSRAGLFASNRIIQLNC